ncbi:hypothetical protein JKF63_02059 [Porcisia hertigi]|uniref:Uncharacterized protein n=1 Tax=Porcisia hertigi TaxID=2761500 RepID=A0A836L2P0_9TRYP|nr:hypothetical protein JKF63_02059 [Porcisia hertigi]
MDAGSVLDNLLTRHRNFVAAQRRTVSSNVHQRSTPSPAPPSKIAEAVGRGVNPLILGLQAHKAESAAREKAKIRRRGSALDVTRTSQKKLVQSPTASSGTHTASDSLRTSSDSARTERTARTQFQALPSSTEVQRAREAAVSATLSARYEELRARQHDEDKARKHSRSNDVSVSRNVAEGHGNDGERGAHRRTRTEKERPPTQDFPLRVATVSTGSRSWRDVWRRRCTTTKILRLSRGVTRASALRRYWYTTFYSDEAGAGTGGDFLSATQKACAACSASGVGEEEAAAAVQPSKTAPAPERLGSPAPPLSVFALKGTIEKRCALRRFRAARRCASTAHFNSQVTTKRCDTTAGVVKAATGVFGTSQQPAATTQAATSTAAPSRTSRRQRKGAIRHILSSSSTSMWTLAARAVAERLGTVAELRFECAAATAPALASATRRSQVGVLPLSLARLFPLFGALVEVQELELTRAPLRSRSSRSARRARQAVAGGGEGVRVAPKLSILQKRKGVVMEEYNETLGILLLPSQSEADMQAWLEGVSMMRAQGRGEVARGSGNDAAASLARIKSSPSIVRVPKHFPGASGSFVELLQLLMLRMPTTSSARHGDGGPASMSSMLAAVFYGEVYISGEDCSVVACHAHHDEENPRLTVEGMRSTAYPLHRLLHRCL